MFIWSFILNFIDCKKLFMDISFVVLSMFFFNLLVHSGIKGFANQCESKAGKKLGPFFTVSNYNQHSCLSAIDTDMLMGLSCLCLPLPF